ncbi:MAG: dynamin family protein [Acidimicrobiales bacterium]
MTDDPDRGALEVLAGQAEVLAGLLAEEPDLAERARTLAERTRQTRFHVAVVGVFKRGKSTLINALLGEEVLPTGVLPLTAIATEISFGDHTAAVTLVGGSSRPVPIGELDRWVTEAGNPDNVRSVAQVRVSVPAPLLRDGLVLVDTPGIESAFEHNTATAREAWSDADGAILVLAADTPLSAVEHAVHEGFAGRSAPLFVVLNKADHLEPAELADVCRFVADRIGEHRLWAVSARAALPGRGGDPGDFALFANALRRFVDRDLRGERARVTRHELILLGERARTRLQLATKAAAMEATALDDVAERLAAVTRGEADRFDADRLLLGDRCRGRADETARDLRTALVAAGRRRQSEVVERAEALSRDDLERALRLEVEAIVRDEVERCRPAAVSSVDAEWNTLASEFRRGTEERIAAIRSVAAELFDVALAPVEIPAVHTAPDRFWFLFLPPPADADPINLLVRRLLPGRWRRRRAARTATRMLAAELDKHAGRAGVDLRERLTTTRTDFERDMADHFAHAHTDIDRAIGQARDRRQTAYAEADDLGQAAQDREVRLDAILAELQPTQGGS